MKIFFFFVEIYLQEEDDSAVAHLAKKKPNCPDIGYIQTLDYKFNKCFSSKWKLYMTSELKKLVIYKQKTEKIILRLTLQSSSSALKS